ncbi:CDP-glycerol glycerophosphotransferase family protein [Leucobacter sp. UT-8R-CII-1-4]|uniref:CDP-glycerol glycerophosphotransferase family protein n=1 Tax=Leucobacter sp. UT-8R-CII-1-4 TaxID=3040075 RepID=UPI0024A7C224|nr:CDP-glycerol glycerophosphotransferase family protein [Leucobacter sp. UT-8R-CII-1-4]MDI6023094.1 CDP-glycerol glycerophosphotransferase family protein [Leucobacter sp. UT-8R-CII-1-4]
MSTGRFEFASGNLQKLLAAPKYVLSALFALFVPRSRSNWVFGSGIGVGEGALEVARALHEDCPDVSIGWLVSTEREAELARAEGFTAVTKHGWAGFWATLRAGQIVVTHGLGDVNRFGIFGGRIINLIHGAPLKKLHLDSPVTLSFGGPAPLRAILRRMYLAGTKRFTMFVAASVTSAERLRSAYRVDPGRVRVLGDPRDDQLCVQANDAGAARAAKARVRELLGLDPAHESEPFLLYAPTWRDGKADPAIPTAEEIEQIHATLDTLGARLLIRSHPLGVGAYQDLLGDRVSLFGADLARDITPLLGAFDTLITDYSSIAIDFSLLRRPIVWFAPDLSEYALSRGLYEPLEVTAAGRVQYSWFATLDRLAAVVPESAARRATEADSRALAERFHAFPEGGAARRVLAVIAELDRSDKEIVPDGAVFFESFYGKQVSCNPLALDREIARRFPDVPRYWSVTSESTEVPTGATAVLVGSPEWFAVRRRATLLIVNDWLRYGFKRGRNQRVLQTWHGTMLKHLALGRPNVSLRTRLAIHRESRRWNLMLSQNPHSTEQFVSNYAFRGEVLETGYPRDDRLAAAVVHGERIKFVVQAAKRELGIADAKHVLAYVPTWRDGGGNVDTLDVQALAAELGDDWTIVARGHTRSTGTYLGVQHRVIDASAHPDVNDVILAADVLVTDYSSVMFDAAVARVPLAFFVPDLASYRDRERGFTFDFEATAPGPLLRDRAELIAALQSGIARGASYEAWCERYVPHDDGQAAERVVDALIQRGYLTAS